jgi:hypothetical protein
MLVEVASYFSAPTPGGGSAVNTSPQRLQPDFPHIAPSISGGEVGGAHLEERDDLLLEGIEFRLEGLDPAVAGPEVVALQ